MDARMRSRCGGRLAKIEQRLQLLPVLSHRRQIQKALYQGLLLIGRCQRTATVILLDLASEFMWHPDQ